MGAEQRAVLVLSMCLASQSALARPPLEIRGNVALNDEVYRAVVVLSEAAEAAEARELAASSRRGAADQKAHFSPDLRELAEGVEQQILDFLKASGYDLASVSVEPTEDRLVADVDEGKLDKIIFVGEDFLSAIQLKFQLALPGDIFNRPLLEEKLERLVEGTDISSVTYEVIPVQYVSHEGIQIEEPTLIPGLRFLKAGSPHELHVYLTHEVRKAGSDLFVGLSGIDGLHVNAGYTVQDGLLDGDRSRFEVRGGVHLGQDFRTRRNPIGLARLRAAAEWATPPLWTDLLRLRADLDASLIGRQRRDLNVARYWYAPLKAALNLEFEITPPFLVSVGGGVEGRFLSRIEAYEGLDLSPVVSGEERREFRPLLQARADLVLDPTSLRRDRRGLLQVLLQGLGPDRVDGSKAIGIARLNLEHAFTFGYDELWFTGGAVYQVGDSTFYDELNVGEFLRTCFAKSINVRRAVGIGLEYRLSLSRDILKVSAFNDVMLHERLGFLREPIGLRVSDDLGLGLHYLVGDLFQVDFYVGLGIDRAEGLDVDVALRIRQAF